MNYTKHYTKLTIATALTFCVANSPPSRLMEKSPMLRIKRSSSTDVEEVEELSMVVVALVVCVVFYFFCSGCSFCEFTGCETFKQRL
jgi:hypothetical protein